MSTPGTSVLELQGSEVSFIAEARATQREARARSGRVVRLGEIVFFSTQAGDAWMLDPGEGTAACLARDGDLLPIPIRESAAEMEIEWHADYSIAGPAFTVVERESGAARTILGYPVAEIERLVPEPAAGTGSDSRLSAARERLKSGRNDPCPCGSGRKYKKCCLRNDEELVRQIPVSRRNDLSGQEPPALSGDTETDKEKPGSRKSRLPRALEQQLDALWDAFRAVRQPTAAQMDELLTALISLPPEATSWSDVLHQFARRKHPDLHAVFRRIATAVPHTHDAGMAFFYWAAAEVFAHETLRPLVSELVDGFCRLDLQSYDANALVHVEDYLLASHFEAEALRLAEHFLPIEREDDRLMPWAVPDACGLIFELRVGNALRSGPHSASSLKVLAGALGRDICEELHADSIENAARVICEPEPCPVWTEEHFAIPNDDIRKSDRAWQECLRLYGALIGVARDAWHCDGYPPGCGFLGLARLLEAFATARAETEKKGRKKKPLRNNLLACLTRDAIEARVASSCRDLMGVKEARARILLDAHEVLARFAVRHRLIAEADAAATCEELARLRRVLEGGR
jgi:hypothetical protein